MNISVANIIGFNNGRCYVFFLNNFILNKQNPSIVYLSGKIGDRLLIKCDEMKVLKNYGNHSDKSKDLEIIIDLNNFNQNFDKTKYIFTKNTSLYTKKFTDLTFLKYCTFNIDPTDSTDFDDAITFDINTNTIYIHIVDIHSQIDIESELDINAILQAYTLYLPNFKQNMFPEEYADNKLSLIKDEKRHVITIEFQPNSEKYEIYQSTIIINKRYNYTNSLPENLNEKDDITLIKLYEVYNKVLKSKNLKKTLYIPYINYIIDSLGNLKELNKELNGDSISHKLIETLMIISNCIISKHLENSFLQRFHPYSSIENLSKQDTNNTVNLLDSFMTIIQYKQANYSLNDSGHFGLNLTSYTHFTSPIRRYFDVINHRILGGIIYNNEFLEKLVKYINEREKSIDILTNLYKKMKLYYSPFLSLKQYDAFITKVVKYGINYIIPDIMLSGFIHISNILPDNHIRWIYEEKDKEFVLKNNDSTYVFSKGKAITIEIIKINQLKLEIIAKVIK